MGKGPLLPGIPAPPLTSSMAWGKALDSLGCDVLFVKQA